MDDSKLKEMSDRFISIFRENVPDEALVEMVVKEPVIFNLLPNHLKTPRMYRRACKSFREAIKALVEMKGLVEIKG